MEFPVSSCPWDPDSWREAGVKLNCSRDNYGRILYQCAPNEGKSSLVEFCLRGSVARIEKGLCVDSLSNGYLGVQKCSQFDYGCPDESYINNEIYKYPACLEINTDEHCYVADPSCPNISRVRENSTDYFTIINGPTTATALQMATNALAAFGYAILVLGILIGLILFFKRRGHIYKRVSTDEETPADDLDGEVIARDIEEYGIDFILKCPFKKEQHDKIAKKLRIPIEILSWSKDDKEQFVRDLREGETRVYHGRCMVVGCGGVGKTTLVNNLRGVYEEEPASTVGLVCHPNVFNVDDKKGLIVATDEEKSRQCTQICMKNLNTKADVTQENQTNLESPVLDNKTIDSDHEINDNGESSEVSSETSNIESKESESIADIEIFEKSQKPSIQIESNELQKKELNAEGGDQIQMIDGSDNAEEQIVKDIKSESEDIAQDIVQPTTEENTRIEKGKVEIDIIPVESIENKKLSIMDFAGQSVYYACHHIYYSPRAFFILVMDMSKKLNEKPKDSCLSQELMYSGWSNLDFMRYWLGSIHAYSSPDVPVILVASHSENNSEKESEYYEKIKRNLPEDLLKHLSLDMLFKVKKKKDENIEKIKICIGGILKNQLHWGERIPTSWVSLEHIITRRKESVKVWKTDELWEYVNGSENCRIKRRDDLLTALNFFNDIGVILFKPQGKLGESIILDVQWFVDAFKCIIMDKEHQPMINRPNHDWEYFDSTGILHKKLLEDTWKDSPFFKHKEGLILHMINLGMMAVLSDEEYYVPCMNKQHYNPAILEGFKVSSTLCFMFQYLPLVIFHRLIATCMQKYQWRIWKGNRAKTRGSDIQSETKTDYCIYHTATIFESGIYKILIGINHTKPFGDKDRIPYLIELQIITLQGKKIELSQSREIREKVEDSLLELMSYYPALYGDSDMYKTGLRCCKSPFGTLNGHKILTFEHNIEGSLVQECIDCKKEIDVEDLISYWKKKKKSKRKKKKDEDSDDNSSCSSETPLVPPKLVTNLDREIKTLDMLTRKSQYKLKVVDVPGDGHCLYHAFSQSKDMHGLPDDPSVLRRRLVKYLESNPTTPTGMPYRDLLCLPLDSDRGALEPEDMAIEEVEGEEDQKELRWQRFLKKIQDGEWGGSLEILGLAQLYNVPVTVLSVGMNSFRLIEISFNHTNETTLNPVVFIGHLKVGGKGAHFVSFRSLYENTIEQPSSMQQGELHRKHIDSSYPYKDGKVIVDHELDKRIGCIEITAKFRTIGTGFRVGSKYVMTAFHVMKDILIPFWRQVYSQLEEEERRPLSWTAENVPVDGGWNLTNLISSLDPSKQEKIINIAEYMITKPALIKFGLLDGKSDILSVLRFSHDIPFASQLHDIVILELSEENKIPPPLMLKDTNIPSGKLHVIGYPKGIELQHDPGCEIIDDQSELTQLVNKGIDFFTSLGHDREEVEKDYAPCFLSTDHILFHCFKSTAHGASGSPLIVIKERPQVTGMLLKGHPYLYYNYNSGKEDHPELLVESGISMEKVHSLLVEHSLIQLAEELFSQNL